MPSTYTLNNGIELIGTGEQSGTWGDTTNTNLGLLDAALDGQVTITLAAAGSSGSPNALPITDGTASNGRNRMVVFSDGGDLGATAYVQLTPNDAEKIIYIRNSLSGSRSVILFQGTYNASNDYEVPAGTTAVVYFDGAGAGAVAANVFNNAHFDAINVVGTVTATTVAATTVNATTVDAGTVEFDNLSGTGAVSVTNILDEDNMASDSATALATQQSIKAYVDAQVGTVDTLAEILAIGNTTGATDIAVDSAQKVQFRDAAIYINSSVDGQLDIVADTEIQIAATTIDVNGALDVSGTALVTGVLTTTAATVSNGGGQFNGAINVGVDDTGYDVKFFGATTGKSLLWDESADSLIVTGTTTLVGTTNLDAVDIDGATQIDATVTVGVDDTGYDVKFFGATAGAYMLWDESADDLILGGAAGLSVNSTALVTGVLTTTAATVFNGGFAAGGVGTFADGSNSAPSLTNTGDLNTGLYFPAADEVGLTVGGTQRLNVSATGIDVTGTVVADGLTVAGTVSFTGGGVQFPTQLSNSFTPNAERTDLLFASNPTSNNALRIGSIASNAGVTLQGTRYNDSALKVDLVLQPDGGNVGIGTSSPDNTLHVNSGGTNIVAKFESTDNIAGILLLDNGGNVELTASGNTFQVQPAGGVSTFSVNSSSVFTPTAGTSNVRLGVNAGNSIVSGTNYNVLIGDEAGTDLNSGDRNVAVGYNAMFDANSAEGCVAIGQNAMRDATSGTYNIAIGDSAMYDGIVTGNHNLAMGYLSLENLTGGIGNIALGREALETLTVGNNNVAVGSFSLEVVNSSENTAVGNYSGQNNTTTDQVFIGYEAGQSTTSGAGQTFVGHSAGKGTGTALTGTNNTAVGRDSGLVLQGNAYSNTFVRSQ
jgi:hypothetical protein